MLMPTGIIPVPPLAEEPGNKERGLEQGSLEAKPETRAEGWGGGYKERESPIDIFPYLFQHLQEQGLHLCFQGRVNDDALQFLGVQDPVVGFHEEVLPQCQLHPFAPLLEFGATLEDVAASSQGLEEAQRLAGVRFGRPRVSEVGCWGRGPYLHQLHDGYQVGQGDLWANEEWLILQELVLQLLDGEVQFLHCFIELLWGHLMAHKERDHHLPHRDMQKRGRRVGASFAQAGAKGDCGGLGWEWGSLRAGPEEALARLAVWFLCWCLLCSEESARGSEELLSGGVSRRWASAALVLALT